MEGQKAPIHPGLYIKENVLPKGLSVTAAAEQLGVGRQAVANLLNGKSKLSPKMALKLEKTFGASPKDLLQLQAEFDQLQPISLAQSPAPRANIPAFLKITARDLEQWVDGNLQARSLLGVLLRKLVHSTGVNLTLVDFPGYDNAEKKGWDGHVEAGVATPWIPLGKTGWEFGCNKDPKQKSEGDYTARVKAIPADERSEINFVFVTPRKWNGKDKWAKEKLVLGEWKSVRAFDASDLEQWLEQSLQAQGWLAEQMGRPAEGVHSLEDQWRVWASVTVPELSKELFAPSVEHHLATVISWIKNPPSSPLIVCGDSKIEAVAFLHCLFESDDPAFAGLKDRVLVFSSPQALRKLTTTSPSFFPILVSEEVEREIGGAYKNQHTIIVRPRNSVEREPNIVLDLLTHEGFRKALEAMGINDHLRADDLGRESGYSPTILRRRLSKVPAICTPEWARDIRAVRSLIPMMLVGAWHTESNADTEILSFLAGTSYHEIEKNITQLLKFDDPPIWSVGKFRGVASKIDAFFAVQSGVTQKDIDEFLFAAEVVLSEKDPALELPEDKRWLANLYGKTREHSGTLRDGICETLVILAVHGNDLFRKRLGIDIEVQIDLLIRRLLSPLTPETLLSQTDKLPLYAEAAPQEFLRIMEEDLKTSDPAVFALMKPADTGLFGGGCPRTGLLWALECLAWKSEQLPRVSLILAKLAKRKISDNWGNKPENSLQSIFRSWMPQTAAPLEDRMKALEVLTERFPAVGWQICLAQLQLGQRIGDYSHRPRWRCGASGAGQSATWSEIHKFERKALDLALSWPDHEENTLGDLIMHLEGLPEEDQHTVWNLVDQWATKESDQRRKAILREQIRRFALRRSINGGINADVRDRARNAYDLLTPTDLIIRSQWLFGQHWVEESFDDIQSDDFDYQEHEDRVRKLRIEALREIWETLGFEGITILLSKSGAAFAIGVHMADGVIEPAAAVSFLENCLRGDREDVVVAKFDEVIRGFILKVETGLRLEITQDLIKVLSHPLICRFLMCSPFIRDTWSHVASQNSEIQERYWNEVSPNCLMKDSPDLNDVIDRLLEVRRPRAAFYAVHLALKAIETSHLIRLLQEVGTCASEDPGAYRLDSHNISSALDVLQERNGVSEEEMARLEFLYLTALEHTKHRIPNLERQVGKSPALFVQALSLIYRRNDGGEDPPEWQVEDAEYRSGLGTVAYRLLENLKRIPGSDETGRVNEQALKTWVKEAQALCIEHGRAEMGDQKIGQLLSAPIVGADSVWPCEEVRKVLEECGTSDMATGVHLGVYNSRGAHFRSEGGGEERGLAGKYRNWSRQLAYEYPFVANLVEGIAASYDRDATREDSEAAVRRRLRH